MGKLINLFNNLLIIVIISLVIYDKHLMVNHCIFSLTQNFVYLNFNFLAVLFNYLAELLFFYNNLLILKILTNFYTLLVLLWLILEATTNKFENLNKYTSYFKAIVSNKCSKLLPSDIYLNKIFKHYNFKNIFLMTILFIYFVSLIQYKVIIEKQEFTLAANILVKDEFRNALYEDIESFSSICNLLIFIFYILILLHIIVALYSIFYDYCTIYINYTFATTLSLIILIIDLSLAYYCYKSCFFSDYNFNAPLFVNVNNFFFGSSLIKNTQLDPFFKYYN